MIKCSCCMAAVRRVAVAQAAYRRLHKHLVACNGLALLASRRYLACHTILLTTLTKVDTDTHHKAHTLTRHYICLHRHPPPHIANAQSHQRLTCDAWK
jgi:hypothetical protein